MKPRTRFSKDNPKLINAPCVLEWYEYLVKECAESGRALQAGIWEAKAKSMRKADIKDTDYLYDDMLLAEINKRTKHGEVVGA